MWLIDSRARGISGCITNKLLDLLNLLDLGGLKTFAFEFLWLLRWYWPVGWSAIASWFIYAPGPGTIFTVVCGKTK
jgi:hypothetical protein